ncbi:hypothetical protein [Streptomyces brasiliscabiei]|uniref:hypothetical protein n=1 Tax=Streptomyces brasiliscabiei TaxID=2736302 RepID=UPI001C11A128
MSPLRDGPSEGMVEPLGGVLISMCKNSAVVGAFGVGRDVFSVSATLTSAQGYADLPVLIGITIGYLAMTLPAALFFHTVERKVAIVR